MSASKIVLDIGVLFVSILLMVTVGMELAPQHFRDVAKRKRVLICLFIGQVVVLPLIGFILVRLLSLPPHISAGILLLAACPVGDIANLYTLLSRGNLALSVTMNVVTCLLSLVTMAAVFRLYDVLLGERFVFAVPTPTLVIRLMLMVMLPVLAGMLVRRKAPGWSLHWTPFLKNASIAGVAFIVIYVIVTQHQLLVSEWGVTAIAGGFFMALALLAGVMIGRLLRLPTADILTNGILFSVRNVGLAMAIAVTLLHRVEYAVFAVVYFLTEVPLLLAFVAAVRRRQ